ncbi:MAG: efflux RND transporter permease subunit, partial [Akkermansiaceae bacterium]|nr:efflux RND transporter permease subunit [Verrucomicrobiales bacterium]
TGGLYLDITPKRAEIARYGLNVEDVLEQVEIAIGGMAIDRTIEGRERYSINVRYSRELRDDVEKLKRVLVPVAMGETGSGGNGEAGMSSSDSPSRRFSVSPVQQIPLGQLVEIQTTSGPPLIKNENGSLTGWVYVDMTGRDIGGYVAEAKKAVHEQIEKAGLLPAGYRFEWTGQYEYMLRVKERLKVVIPITLALIFVLLYMNFKSIPETFIILLSIPFAMTGSIWFLWIMGYNMSIAVWVGIIALAGLAAQTGTVMIIYLDEAFHAYQKAGRMNTQHDLFEAITYGAVQRVRPKLMTVCMITFGLVPALWAHGAGAEAIQRIAAPMIGGLITSTILTLEIVPAIYSLWRGRQVEWVKGPRPRKKTWSELNAEFVEMERLEHGGEPVAAETESVETPKAKSRLTRNVILFLLVALALGLGIFLWQKSGSSQDSASQSETAPASAPAAPVAATLPKLDLTAEQRASVTALLRAGDSISTNLASDNLQGFNQSLGVLDPAIQTAAEALGPEHSWTPLLQKVRKARLKPAGDLKEARDEFIAFSSAFVDFTKAVRQQDPASASVKIYRCPMAPKPGFWMQLQGPLRNPYFGVEMLDCGVEVAP